MTKSEFLKLLREVNRFTESQINLAFTCLDVGQLDKQVIHYLHSPNFIPMLERKLRDAVQMNEGCIIIELVSKKQIAIIDTKDQELTLLPNEVFRRFDNDYRSLFKAIGTARRLNRRRVKRTETFTTDGVSLTTYCLDHKRHILDNIVDDINFAGLDETYVKHTNFLQMADANLHDWVCDYVMKLSGRKLTISLEDGLKLDIPSMV